MEKTAAAAIKPPSSSSYSSSSSQRALEIKVISGEDLRINRSQSSVKNSFVVVSSETSYKITKIDSEGGSNPIWDEKIVIDMPMHARFFTVEIQCKKNGSNKIVGSAKIPVSDFMGGLVPENYLHFLSYRLWDKQGQRNGIINLSVRVKNPAGTTGIGNYSGNFALIPMDANLWSYNQGQVVTGIPVKI